MKNGTFLKFFKNFSQLLLSMIVTMIGTFLCYTILGRRMSVEDYADFSSILALVAMIAVFVNNIAAGIVANREIALKPNASFGILRKFFWIRVSVCLVAFFFLYYFIVIDYCAKSIIFWPAAILLVQEVFWELFEQVAFGLKITRMSMLLNIIAILLWLIIVAIIPKEQSTLLITLLCYSFIYLIKTIIYGIWIYKQTLQYASFNSAIQLKQLLIFSLPYLYNRILGSLTTQLPVLLLRGYNEISETAYYSVGEKYTTPITRITTVAVSSAFPFFAKALKDNHQKAAKLISDSILLIVSIGACVAVLLCSTSDIWLVKLLGEKYKGATEAFNYQVWFAIVLSADCIFSMILSCDYKQKVLSVVTTIDVVISLLFIWQGMNAGAKGVALAKLFAAVICLLYHLIIIAKLYGNRKILLRLIFSWGLFLFLLYVTLFQNNIFLKFSMPIFALGVCMFLNRDTFKVLYQKLLALKRKE